MDAWIWIWLSVVCCSAILEFVSMQMISIWFVAGGIVALILAIIGGVASWIQIVVFITLSMILLLSFRKLALKCLLRNTNTKTNIDSIIGRETTLIDDISLDNTGAVKVNGVVWTAIAESDNITIPAGTLVVISEIRGNKLIVRTKGD
ncbi:MAG: NfeD family protein [Clostridia bacterium]|nr:NfeD family protein [Clostridia bacterium]